MLKRTLCLLLLSATCLVACGDDKGTQASGTASATPAKANKDIPLSPSGYPLEFFPEDNPTYNQWVELGAKGEPAPKVMDWWGTKTKIQNHDYKTPQLWTFHGCSYYLMATSVDYGYAVRNYEQKGGFGYDPDIAGAKDNEYCTISAVYSHSNITSVEVGDAEMSHFFRLCDEDDVCFYPTSDIKPNDGVGKGEIEILHRDLVTLPYPVRTISELRN